MHSADPVPDPAAEHRALSTPPPVPPRRPPPRRAPARPLPPVPAPPTSHRAWTGQPRPALLRAPVAPRPPATPAIPATPCTSFPSGVSPSSTALPRSWHGRGPRLRASCAAGRMALTRTRGRRAPVPPRPLPFLPSGGSGARPGLHRSEGLHGWWEQSPERLCPPGGVESALPISPAPVPVQRRRPAPHHPNVWDLALAPPAATGQVEPPATTEVLSPGGRGQLLSGSGPDVRSAPVPCPRAGRSPGGTGPEAAPARTCRGSGEVQGAGPRRRVRGPRRAGRGRAPGIRLAQPRDAFDHVGREPPLRRSVQADRAPAAGAGASRGPSGGHRARPQRSQRSRRLRHGNRCSGPFAGRPPGS